MAGELGDDHGFADAGGRAFQLDEAGEGNDGDDAAAQGNHAFDSRRHVGGQGDGRGGGNLPHLENVDAEGLMGAQGEQQQLHLVGPRQLGAGIHGIQQFVGLERIHEVPFPLLEQTVQHFGEAMGLELGHIFVHAHG
jgi:hypothetical protein